MGEFRKQKERLFAASFLIDKLTIYNLQASLEPLGTRRPTCPEGCCVLQETE